MLLIQTYIHISTQRTKHLCKLNSLLTDKLRSTARIGFLFLSFKMATSSDNVRTSFCTTYRGQFKCATHFGVAKYDSTLINHYASYQPNKFNLVTIKNNCI